MIHAMKHTPWKIQVYIYNLDLHPDQVTVANKSVGWDCLSPKMKYHPGGDDCILGGGGRSNI